MYEAICIMQLWRWIERSFTEITQNIRRNVLWLFIMVEKLVLLAEN